jgi:predicted phage terminase large subunit-like protein
MTEAKELEELINDVDYGFLNNDYIPQTAALHFLTFIKLVNGTEGEENKSPVIHLDMLDHAAKHDDNLYVSFRGSAKTTALHEYMFLYLATYGDFFDFGEVNVAMYISDTIDNGVKSMRKNLEFRYNKSEFLQKYVPTASFTDVRWEFTNITGKSFVVRGFGASTGVRGFKEYGQRPTWCGFDDLMSDKNAESATIIRDIKNIVYKAARQAMHPKKRKLIWTGTPFNKRDPLYSAAGSTGWNTKVYPICEKYPCTRKEFKGAWEDRFSYEFVKKEYDTLKANGELQAFNQELMLRIISDEDRLIEDKDIRWYDDTNINSNIAGFNIYITTDFATSSKAHADFSTIFVWGYNSNGDWYWIDGTVKKQDMGKNMDDLFRLCQRYHPLKVGVEVSGQQGGFIPWIQREMMSRRNFFTLASDKNSGEPGIRPSTDKMTRIQVMVPMFKMGKMFFPKGQKETPEMVEIIEELSLITKEKFQSKHDDCIDPISMLSVMEPWKPSMAVEGRTNGNNIWEFAVEETDSLGIDSYIV